MVLGKNNRLAAGFVREVDGRHSDAHIELLERTIDDQDHNLQALLEENNRLRARLENDGHTPISEDPDHTWDIYLLGASSGLAVGVLLRKLASMMF